MGEAVEASPWAGVEDSPPLSRLRCPQARQGAGQPGPPLPPFYSGLVPRNQTAVFGGGQDQGKSR